MTAMEFPRPQDKLAILKHIPLFASCTAEQLQLVGERTRLMEYKKDECVYREGDRADAFYIVSSGRLRVFSGAEGHEHVLTVLHNGDTFGEISLLTGEMHSATVEAINDTLVLQLEKPDFDELINRIPSLVLYLSRLLSKRLRTKQQGGGPADATVIAVYGAARGVGRTLFSAALATFLRGETRQPVIVVDFSSKEGLANLVLSPARRVGRQSVPIRSFWSEEPVEQEAWEHPLGFHVLDAASLLTAAESERGVAPLVSGLVTRYHYLVLDLPTELNTTVLKALTQSDLVYVLTDATKTCLLRTNALIQQLRESGGHLEGRMKLALNMMETAEERLSPSEAAASLGRPIDVLLPAIPSASGVLSAEEFLQGLSVQETAYALVVRRVARELGGLLVGLALGSGAALGLAHIGVLKVLERERIPIDLIAGSSVGAMIGALWASGKSADELEQIAKRFEQPWRLRALFLDFGIPLFCVVIGIFAGALVIRLAGVWTGILFGLIVAMALGLVFGPLAGGPLQGARVTQFLQELLGDMTFEETRIPLKILASNPTLREEVVFESGRLVEAVRASISIPGIFKPVRARGKVCIDGGVINPIPISVLKKAGAKRIIAVNVFPTTEEVTIYAKELERRRAEREAQLASKHLFVRLASLLRRELRRSVTPLIFDVIMRSMQSMEYQIAEVACHDADLVLRPTVPGSSWLEFYHPAKFIQRGEEEGRRHLEAIKRVTGAEPVGLTTDSSTGTITSA
ncbi:MAG: patatin-like phospholipase family protein [Candidatus Omnitrophica bacterium]|nr:patatin-like phospholipase family protein [Candidatus Omnitrophota bacterium]